MIEKYLLAVIFFCIFSSAAYILLAYIIMCLEKGELFHPVLEWGHLWRWYQKGNSDVDGYIPTIFVASISLLLAVLTFVQSHYSRIQDRAMMFPKNYIDVVSIGIDVVSNVRLMRKYFDPLEAKTLIELRFREGFSTYYKAYPFRLFICLRDKVSAKEEEWEEVVIYNFRHSNLPTAHSSCEMLIEGSESRLLRKYCDRAGKNDDCRLKMVMDIRWTNKLMPLWCRMFSDLYIRQAMEADWIKKVEKKMQFSDSYDVLHIEHSRAQMASWFIGAKCRKTIKRWNKEEKRTKRNQSICEARKGRDGNGWGAFEKRNGA